MIVKRGVNVNKKAEKLSSFIVVALFLLAIIGALVIGSEDKGIRRLTRENCDELIKIDMSEKMDSLNASVSTGILLFEISRQIKLTETNIVK